MSTKIRREAKSSMLQVLRKLAPLQTIIHIGAGDGNGDMHQWQHWDVPYAWIIDANPERLQWAETHNAIHPNWFVKSALLADMDGQAEFYQASNSFEDGLLDPDQLKSLWPNLRTTNKELLSTRRLDTLLAEASTSASDAWLFIDCLPALAILKGANNTLNNCSVIWLRALLKPNDGIDADATLSVIEAFLLPLGFRCVDIIESNHPAIGYALFVRDWRLVLQPQISQLAQAHEVQSKLAAEQIKLATDRQMQVEQLTKARDELAKHASDRQAEVDQLTRIRDEQIKLATDRQLQIEQLTTARDEQLKLATERQQQVEALTKAKVTVEQEKTVLAAKLEEIQKQTAQITQVRDQQAKLAAERQTQNEQLTHTCDEQAKLATERQAQLEKVSKAHGEAQTQVTTLKQATEAQSMQIKVLQGELHKSLASIKNKDASLAEMKSELVEHDAHLQMLNDEMTRAEAQIDVIKDLLLRESGL